MATSPVYFVTEQTTDTQVPVDIYSADYSINPRTIKPLDVNSTIDLSFEGLMTTNEASASFQQPSESINIQQLINI
jgi:hypothetical protein